MKTLGASALLVCLLVACGTDAPSSSSHVRADRTQVAMGAIVPAPDLASRVPRGVVTFSRSVAERIDVEAPEVGPSSTARRARVSLPLDARGVVRVEDRTSGTAVAFALHDAEASSARTHDGLAVYRSALAGADVVHRPTAEGTEDYVLFAARPAVEKIAYDVDVHAAAGLRLVENTLELLDSNGTPRLRVAPPYVVDANGDRSAARLAVQGCAFDTSPAPPWGRPVTLPGAATCTIEVAWKTENYPAIVDPAWTTTGSMTVVRQYHTATLLPSGRVFVVGGQGVTATYRDAELYDPTTGTFGATGSPTNGYAEHSATLLASGKVLVAGGYGLISNQFHGLKSAELYDPSAGTFSGTGSMSISRFDHAAVLLASGKVLVAGAMTGDAGSTSSTATAELYNPSTGTFAPTGSMTAARYAAVGALLANGKAVVSYGAAAVDLYDPTAGTFSSIGNESGLDWSGGEALRQTSTVLASGKLLIAGGGTSTGMSSSNTYLYDPVSGTFASGPALLTPRGGHTATLLSSGLLVLAGGIDSARIGNVEYYDPASNLLHATTAMTSARGGHTETLLASGKVLVTGGTDATGAFSSSAELLTFVATGQSCTTNDECQLGFCADGVCCDSACTGQCEACDVTGHVGTCSPVTGAPHGKAACANAVDATCGGRCDGTLRAACSLPSSATSCGTACVDDRRSDSTCDGAGNCVAGAAHPCTGNLTCADAKSCRAGCEGDGDCVIGFSCVGGECVTGAVCADPQTSKAPDGTSQSCAPYRCDADAGTCGQSCTSVDDCSAPNVCSSNGQCVAPSAAGSAGSADSSGCAVARPGTPLRGGPVAGLFGLAFLLLRRRARARLRVPGA